MNNLDFRVYDPELKEISYDVTLYANGWIECVFNSGIQKKYESNAIKVMQWSGAYAIKNTKIFEGDILKNRDNEYFLVVFEESCFQAFNVWNRYSCLYEHLFFHEHIFFEVVGNIHENGHDYEGWFQ